MLTFVKDALGLPPAISYGSAFSRAVHFDTADTRVAIISGTASIGPKGETVFEGSFQHQFEHMWANVIEVLIECGMGLVDIAHTRYYLKDIDRDYDEFNRCRRRFFSTYLVDRPYPASTCVEARLCRPELLVEVEVTAIRRLTGF